MRRTWDGDGVVMVDEMGGAAQEFCEFSGAPQELLALIGGEVIRGGRGLGECDDWVGHGGGGRGGVARRMGQLLWVITRPEAQSASWQATQK